MKRTHAQGRRLVSGLLATAMVFGSAMTAFAETGAAAGTDGTTSAPEAGTNGSETKTASPSNASPSNAEKPTEAKYVLMNIPYADFYAAEIEDGAKVDGVSSATKNKTRAGNLANGSYHVNTDGSSIDGITFPVKVGDGVDLSKYTQVKDTDSLTITVKLRGKETTTVYTASNALFESKDYAYYVLTEEPKFYKEATLEDGKLVFGEVEGAETQEIAGTAEIKSGAKHCDYEIKVDAGSAVTSETKVYAAVLETETGDTYGLRHVDNIWKSTELGFNVGYKENADFTDYYESLVGQTIDKITYYTEDGIYELETHLDVVPQYVLMNIPYADFYANEVVNDVKVDGMSSATKNKPRTGSLAGGSYHANADGSSIDGVTFPVKVGSGVDLTQYKKVTDEDSVDITVTNRGKTSTTTYKGQDALFENEDYAYYALTSVPAMYKEATAADGTLSFAKAVGEVQPIEGSAELKTESSYGDYQINVTAAAVDDAEKVYGVVLGTKEGSSYGLRHMENIWRKTNLAFCTGFTDAVHNCPTSSAHYEAIMGQTIDTITYYTSDGIYQINTELYVPVKFEGELAVADAAVTAGQTTITLTGLPADFDAEYAVKGLNFTVDGTVLSFTDAAKGQYTLTVSDKSGRYADLSADFILYTETMPASYSYNNGTPALVKKNSATEDAFKDYLKNITSVTVDGVEYAATGRGAVVLIKEDGTLDLGAAAFEGTGTHTVTVASTGYQSYTFTYDPSPSSSSSRTPSSSGSGYASGVYRDGKSTSTGSAIGASTAGGQWIKDSIGWWYQNTDGTYPADGWNYLYWNGSYQWYRFRANGYMVAGWYTDTDGSRYFLHNVADGTQGYMYTGWHQIDGQWYYFRENVGGPQGSLVVNGTTPDGYQVDANGAWIQ